jgi:hypothetical protein
MQPPAEPDHGPPELDNADKGVVETRITPTAGCGITRG